jgi:hypothetical protein
VQHPEGATPVAGERLMCSVNKNIKYNNKIKSASVNENEMKQLL